MMQVMVGDRHREGEELRGRTSNKNAVIVMHFATSMPLGGVTVLQARAPLESRSMARSAGASAAPVIVGLSLAYEGLKSASPPVSAVCMIAGRSPFEGLEFGILTTRRSGPGGSTRPDDSSKNPAPAALTTPPKLGSRDGDRGLGCAGSFSISRNGEPRIP